MPFLSLMVCTWGDFGLDLPPVAPPLGLGLGRPPVPAGLGLALTAL